MVQFVLVATQRSGTGFLRSLLNTHPQIHLYPELFLDQDYAYPVYFYHFWLQKIRADEANITLAARNHITHEYLDTIYASKQGKAAVGIDVKYNQFEIVYGLAQTLLEKRISVVHLVRQNILKTLLSSRLNGMQKELGRKSHDTKLPPPVQVVLKPDVHLFAEFQQRQAQIQFYRALFSERLPYLEVTYEGLVGNSNAGIAHGDTIDRVLDFLGVTKGDIELHTQLKKTNPRSLRDLIANYEEVAEVLRKTQWKYLLDEN
jgi:hypothetical protein